MQLPFWFIFFCHPFFPTQIPPLTSMKPLKSTTSHLEFRNWGEREGRKERKGRRENESKHTLEFCGGKSPHHKYKMREMSWNAQVRGKYVSQRCVSHKSNLFLPKNMSGISQKPASGGSHCVFSALSHWSIF